MSSATNDELPGLGKWLPANIDLEFVMLFPVAVPDDAWLKFVPDPDRGLPAVHIDAAWISDEVLHQATISGFTFGEGDDEGERELIRQGQLPLASINRLNYDIESGDGQAELDTGETVTGLPGFLIDPHMD
ncbi:hypothetical protein [Streptomyces sp. NPDC056464]|uniref:hypothetical protein n=1 Tax=Streptomyces sp. NPDC056464 TaxID=3345828 RepID=UPI0036B25334